MTTQAQGPKVDAGVVVSYGLVVFGFVVLTEERDVNADECELGALRREVCDWGCGAAG